MEQNEKTAREELLDLIKESVSGFLEFLKPNPSDKLTFKIIKTILKIPVALFTILISPVLIALLGIIFVVMI